MTIVPNDVSWDNYFMSLAFLVSCRSKDSRTKCGAVLVDDGKQCYTGYNGCPPSYADKLLSGPAKHLHVIHAEINAMQSAGLKFCRSQGNLQLFLTFRPCPMCCLQIVNFNVARVVYYSEYKSEVNNQELSELIRHRGKESDIVGTRAFTLEKYEGPLLFSHSHMGIDQ